MERLAYTPREACEALRIGRTKLYELFANGDLKAVALGGKTLIPRDALENFIASLPAIRIQRTPEADAPQSPSRHSTSEKNVKAVTTPYAVTQKRFNPSPVITE